EDAPALVLGALEDLPRVQVCGVAFGFHHPRGPPLRRARARLDPRGGREVENLPVRSHGALRCSSKLRRTLSTAARQRKRIASPGGHGASARPTSLRMVAGSCPRSSSTGVPGARRSPPDSSRLSTSSSVTIASTGGGAP